MTSFARNNNALLVNRSGGQISKVGKVTLTARARFQPAHWPGRCLDTAHMAPQVGGYIRCTATARVTPELTLALDTGSLFVRPLLGA